MWCDHLPFKVAGVAAPCGVVGVFFLVGYFGLVLPTGWRGAFCLFFEPLGRPGPGTVVLVVLAGFQVACRARRKPARTRPGVISPGGWGGCQGSRVTAARRRASHSWAWQAMMT